MTEETEDGVRDDQFLVSDASENKFYGTVHGGGASGSIPGPALSHITRKIQVAKHKLKIVYAS